MSERKSGALLEVAARRLERAAVDRIIDGPAIAREMFDWADAHAALTSKSPLEIKTDKPLLFWGAEQGHQRDADRAAADVAMASLRRGGGGAMNKRIRALLERARWDLDDALTERNVSVKMQLRNRARQGVKLARIIQHFEIREAKAAAAVTGCQNVINDRGTPCGDEGRMCESCQADAMADHAYLRGLPRHAVFNDQQATDERNQELRDAGRGHLVSL